MSDAEDAARWRKIAAFLRVEVEEREHWHTVQVSTNKRTEERKVEWTWQVDVHPDHSWKLYGSTTEKDRVPQSVADVIDMLDAQPSGDEQP